jgi:hypothetical protein
MRLLWLLALAGLIAGCTDGLARRRAELTQWIGRPEAALVGLMGVPDRTYETEGMKFLTYKEQQIDITPGMPYYYGPGPLAYGGAGLPATATIRVCETTFTIADGVVRAFSLRGNAC